MPLVQSVVNTEMREIQSDDRQLFLPPKCKPATSVLGVIQTSEVIRL
jgi:hypothetical protein